MRFFIRIAIVLSVFALTGAAFAASEEDSKAALAKADAAIKQAHALKNEWTATAAEYKKAQAAAAAGKFDDAVKLAGHAEALANASVAQAKEQEKLWPEAVIR